MVRLRIETGSSGLSKEAACLCGSGILPLKIMAAGQWYAISKDRKGTEEGCGHSCVAEQPRGNLPPNLLS